MLYSMKTFVFKERILRFFYSIFVFLIIYFFHLMFNQFVVHWINFVVHWILNLYQHLIFFTLLKGRWGVSFLLVLFIIICFLFLFLWIFFQTFRFTATPREYRAKTKLTMEFWMPSRCGSAILCCCCCYCHILTH